jgi:hypothetical protein
MSSTAIPVLTLDDLASLRCAWEDLDADTYEGPETEMSSLGYVALYLDGDVVSHGVIIGNVGEDFDWRDHASPLAIAVLEAIQLQYGEGSMSDALEFCDLFDDDDDEQSIYFDGGEFWILNETEREEAWDASLQSYLDECILPELPSVAQMYFDEEAWKQDARFDGCGHALNGYDGVELEASARDSDGDTVWRYVYRVN